MSAPQSRRDARRTAFILVYQWDVTGRELASLYDGALDPYAAELAEGVVEAAGELDRRITSASEGWPADRLGAVERSILRLALLELDRGLAGPIAIDEAVRLAKRYASEDAAKLVNGVLGRIEREREVVQ